LFFTLLLDCAPLWHNSHPCFLATKESHVHYQFAFRASQALALPENRRPKRSPSPTMMLAVAVLAATLTAVPAAADVIYGTSGTSSNIYAYNTQTQTTSTISTDLNSPYGIAYNPNNGNLYVVDTNPSESTEKIEIYSTSGTDLGLDIQYTHRGIDVRQIGQPVRGHRH
jgi:hypothetical protein